MSDQPSPSPAALLTSNPEKEEHPATRGNKKKMRSGWRKKNIHHYNQHQAKQTYEPASFPSNATAMTRRGQQTSEQKIANAMNEMHINNEWANKQATDGAASKADNDGAEKKMIMKRPTKIDTSTNVLTTMSYSAPPTAILPPARLTISPPRQGHVLKFPPSGHQAHASNARITPSPPLQLESHFNPSVHSLSDSTPPTNPFASPTASRLLDSIALAGYDLPHLKHPTDTLRQTTLVLHRKDVPPIERLHGLLSSFHTELNTLMWYVIEQPKWADPNINAWKEAVLMRLMTEVTPGLGNLIERIGCDVNAGMRANAAGVRAFVGTNGGGGR